jgi:hypothetical protein
MFRQDTAVTVKVHREGRRTTTVPASVSDECCGPLSITTENGEGWWGAHRRRGESDDLRDAPDAREQQRSGLCVWGVLRTPRPDGLRPFLRSARLRRAVPNSRSETVGSAADLAQLVDAHAMQLTST